MVFGTLLSSVEQLLAQKYCNMLHNIKLGFKATRMTWFIRDKFAADDAGLAGLTGESNDGRINQKQMMTEETEVRLTLFLRNSTETRG